LCWRGDDHPRPLIECATSWLVVNKVLLPDVSVLGRFVGRIRDRAQKRFWKRLVAALDEKQRERIAKMFDKTSEISFAALDALRTVRTQRSSSELLHHLDRLDAIRAFDLRPSPQRRAADGAHRSSRAETLPRRGLGMGSPGLECAICQVAPVAVDRGRRHKTFDSMREKTTSVCRMIGPTIRRGGAAARRSKQPVMA
jgi:hypothetical protein